MIVCINNCEAPSSAPVTQTQPQFFIQDPLFHFVPLEAAKNKVGPSNFYNKLTLLSCKPNLAISL